ncbi:hypothetical protein RINTHM_5090 [Richelia intracellularis HM01]|uniref:hypothetical protein n=1 Tax=Richelia intracellularis TaxID=1164990 RepID=UPI0002B59D77|nr:hypothetical protein [Richelia intracellularis]CCH64977.1 hypothetical protein RINTHM_5090 [Richelia intracellularis HM01]
MSKIISQRGTRANHAKNQAPTGATVIPIKTPLRKALDTSHGKILCGMVDNFIDHGCEKGEKLEKHKSFCLWQGYQ